MGRPSKSTHTALRVNYSVAVSTIEAHSGRVLASGTVESEPARPFRSMETFEDNETKKEIGSPVKESAIQAEIQRQLQSLVAR